MIAYLANRGGWNDGATWRRRCRAGHAMWPKGVARLADEQDDLAAEWESMVGTDDDGSPDMATDASQEQLEFSIKMKLTAFLGAMKRDQRSAKKGVSIQY